MKHLKKYNESVKDFLKPKQNEEILKELDKLPIHDKMIKSCQFGFTSIVKDILDKKLIKNNSTNIYIHIAVDSNHLDIAKLLIDYGFKINMINARLISAIDNNNIELTQFLIDNGANVNHTNGGLIVRVINNNNIEMLKLLFDNGANIFKVDLEDWMIDLINGGKHNEILKLLITNIPSVRNNIDNIINKHQNIIKKFKSLL